MDLKTLVPLNTYGWDEDYIMNKFWLDGLSSAILYGVGDGMIPWCSLQMRIPILCLYDKEIHKKTIEKFLLEKIIKKMGEATPTDTRWYRTNAQLGCRDGEEGEEGAGARASAAAKAKAAAAAAAKAAAAKGKGKRTPEEAASDSSEDSSSSSKKSRKGDK